MCTIAFRLKKLAMDKHSSLFSDEDKRFITPTLGLCSAIAKLSAFNNRKKFFF
jgi:hypothetical protein